MCTLWVASLMPWGSCRGGDALSGHICSRVMWCVPLTAMHAKRGQKHARVPLESPGNVSGSTACCVKPWTCTWTRNQPTSNPMLSSQTAGNPLGGKGSSGDRESSPQ